MKIAMLCSQVQPVQAKTHSFYITRNRCFHVSVAASLQVRLGLRYATANNEDEAHVDVYASGFWGGKQTSEGIF